MSEAVLRQREATKKIMQKRLKERDELKKKLAAQPSKKGKKPKPTIKDPVPTKNALEYGMSEKVIKERERIKAIKEKRRKSKLQGTGTAAPPTAVIPDLGKKPSPMKKAKSMRKVKKDKGNKGKDEDDNNGVAKVPKRRLSKLKDKGMAAQGVDIYQTELALLKEENVELKKQLKMSEFIKKKYEIAKSENTLFKEQVNVLNEENEALKAEIAALRKKLEEHSIKAPDGFDHNDVIDTHDGDDSTRNQTIDPALLNGSGGDKQVNGGGVNTKNDDNKEEPKEEDPKKEKDEDSDSDSDSSSDDEDDGVKKPPTKNQMRKPPSSSEDSDSSDDDELPPEEEEPDQGESEEVIVQNTDNKENTNGNIDDDGDDSDDGAGSASSSASSEEHEWEEWEPSQIADWMLSLDSKYKKYEKTLRKQLAEEEMHGSLLEVLEISDLDRFGIKSAKHQKQILIELKKLTKQPLPESE